MEQEHPFVSVNDELPKYDDLASKEGPNSRFGRWKDWVEKRAAERYAEDTPERQQARRMKGWGPHVDTQISEPPPPRPLPTPPQSQPPQVRPQSSNLRRTQTVLSNSSPPDCEATLASSASYTTRGEGLPPSHLKLHTFGSRFLPHSDVPILTLLPLFNDTKLLIGHMNGLSVLDLNPDASMTELGSHEPRRRDIWHGEGVYQLALLEYEELEATRTPQGVILALVGGEPPEGGSEKDNKEHHKAIRMYSLASLASITAWATTGESHQPLRLSHASSWESRQSTQKKHKSQPSGSRGLRSLRLDGSLKLDVSARDIHPYDPDVPPTPPPKDPPRSSPSPAPGRTLNSPEEANARRRSSSACSDWEMVGHESLPLRWATDYVPLAPLHSKLATQSVLFFELHRCPGRGRITARLAIVTKQSVFFYESVRGERAFRFVKEFYTPTPARSARFVYQSTHDTMATIHLSVSGSLAPPRSRGRGSAPSSFRRASFGDLTPPSLYGGGQLSLFLVFEKKAGLIRICDSSVEEVDLWGEPGSVPKSTFRRSITPLENLTNKEWKGGWVAPAEVTLPLAMGVEAVHATTGVDVYLLTRGKRTHILPSPLPTPLVLQAPLQVLKWGVQPTQVVPRVCEHAVTAEPFLQVTALSERGVEVQEVPLAFLSAAKGKARAHDEPVVAEADVGPGGAGFLCTGGHWTDVPRRASALQRQVSTSTTDSADLKEKRAREQGFYAWTQKGYDDWRVFWLGGSSHDPVPPGSP